MGVEDVCDMEEQRAVFCVMVRDDWETKLSFLIRNGFGKRECTYEELEAEGTDVADEKLLQLSTGFWDEEIHGEPEENDAEG